MLGATPFSIYATYPAEEIEYLMTDAASKVAIIEQAFLPVMLKARENLPGLEHLIVVDGEAPEGTLLAVRRRGLQPGFDVAAAASEVGPDDILTLIYTSGTTGRPKGVQLSHHAIMFSAHAIDELIPLAPDRG